MALADIADRLRSLLVLAADYDPDPAKVHLLLLSVGPWDPELAAVMRHRNVRIEEELTLDALLQDLSS